MYEWFDKLMDALDEPTSRASRSLAPDGEYRLMISNVEHTYSKAGNQMLVVTIKFADDDSYWPIKEYLLFSKPDKMDRFFESFSTSCDAAVGATAMMFVGRRSYVGADGQERIVNTLDRPTRRALPIRARKETENATEHWKW